MLATMPAQPIRHRLSQPPIDYSYNLPIVCWPPPSATHSSHARPRYAVPTNTTASSSSSSNSYTPSAYHSRTRTARVPSLCADADSASDEDDDDIEDHSSISHGTHPRRGQHHVMSSPKSRRRSSLSPSPSRSISISPPLADSPRAASIPLSVSFEEDSPLRSAVEEEEEQREEGETVFWEKDWEREEWEKEERRDPFSRYRRATLGLGVAAMKKRKEAWAEYEGDNAFDNNTNVHNLNDDAEDIDHEMTASEKLHSPVRSSSFHRTGTAGFDEEEEEEEEEVNVEDEAASVAMCTLLPFPKMSPYLNAHIRARWAAVKLSFRLRVFRARKRLTRRVGL